MAVVGLLECPAKFALRNDCMLAASGWDKLKAVQRVSPLTWPLLGAPHRM